MGISETAAGLIGAGLGAAGAIGAQFVAEATGARREARRLAWEREQAKVARDEAQANKFSERRLELFVDLLELIRQTEDAMREGKDLRGAPRRQYEEWTASVAPTMAKLQILAPKVYLKAQSVYNALLSLFVTLEQAQAGMEPFSPTVDGALRDAIWELRITMREVLQIEGEDWIVIEQQTADRASD